MPTIRVYDQGQMSCTYYVDDCTYIGILLLGLVKERECTLRRRYPGFAGQTTDPAPSHGG
ncbi:hypothetical protein [Acidocella aminolytica]|uniref:hypothetical protein n=1 Tax=Acidocella aminolytica TaxID=33998 RepID=UPI001114FE84|nr:hypothetical protein [Acidocella aminolytica]GBQ35907.1 hypothetical protein AA11237_1091 [Acidocella aminolytica 101 = DSM 11237]